MFSFFFFHIITSLLLDVGIEIKLCELRQVHDEYGRYDAGVHECNSVPLCCSHVHPTKVDLFLLDTHSRNVGSSSHIKSAAKKNECKQLECIIYELVFGH